MAVPKRKVSPSRRGKRRLGEAALDTYCVAFDLDKKDYVASINKSNFDLVYKELYEYVRS